jgi:hypothetical protein
LAEEVSIEIGIEIAKYLGKRASKFLHKMFRRGISPLSGFEEGDTYIVLSSLYPTSLTGTCFKPIEAISKTSVRGIPVVAPLPFTGVRDSFGLARLAAELVKSEINFELRIDPVPDQEREKGNLILFGSPTSNLVAHNFYHQYLPPVAGFRYDSLYATMIYNGTSFRGGNFGVALKYRNPWNGEYQLLWLAGIGPTGTEASALFVTQEFDTATVPANIRKSQYWIAIVKAEVTDGYVTGASFRGGKPLK